MVEQFEIYRAPNLLADDAQEILRHLGYDDQLVDNAYGFKLQRDWLGGARPGVERWNLTPVFWYRECPRAFVANELTYGGGSDSQVGFESPGWTVDRMRGVQLTRHGHLRWFRAIPDDAKFEIGDESATPDWYEWFSPEVVGFDLREFETTNQIRPSPDAADVIQCWEGKLPDSNDQVYVQAAAFRGRPTFFSVTAERPKTADKPVASSVAAAVYQAGQLALAIVCAVAVVGAPFLALRHHRSQRFDHVGARRVAVAMFLISIVGWVLKTSHVGNVWEVFLLIDGLRNGLFAGGMAWFIYVGTEPFIRRHMPQSLTAWARLLRGELGDTRVGRELLVAVSLRVVLESLTVFRAIATGNSFVNPYSLTRRLLGDWSSVGDMMTTISAQTSIIMLFFLYLRCATNRI